MLINRELITVFKKEVEECECVPLSAANCKVGVIIFVVLPFYACPATLSASWFFCEFIIGFYDFSSAAEGYVHGYSKDLDIATVYFAYLVGAFQGPSGIIQR